MILTFEHHGSCSGCDDVVGHSYGGGLWKKCQRGLVFFSITPPLRQYGTTDIKLSRHVSSQYIPTGSTQIDERGDFLVWYKVYVLRLKTYCGLR